MNCRHALLSILIAVLAVLGLTDTTATAAKRRGPDLTIKSVSVPSPITAGEAVKFHDATRNGGHRGAKRTTTRFVLSADARRDAKDAVLAARKVKTLKAGKVARGTAQGRVPASAKAGKAFVIACADGGSAVKELSERNNCKAVPVTVRLEGSASHGTPPPTPGGNSGGENPGGGGQIPDELPPPLVEPAKDPAQVAPPVNATTNTTMAAGTRFLYSGDDPIQKGVEDGTIKPRRVAVLRGKVTDKSGKPLPAVKVTVLGHPEFGYTATRPDGGFDIAVNGGHDITLVFERPGLITIQATVDAPWADFADVHDVAMTPYDADVTTIDADSAAPIQVASGGPVTDGDGTRSATLMFEKGTDAEMTLPSGDTKPLEDLHVRATEYTVGPNGENAMPGNLPDTSAYTYAVEFSIDEAEKAGAREVKFDKPVATYVDDFLGFRAGTKVPAAYYDEQKAHWVPSDDGLVIKVLSVANGIATVDIDGDDQPDGADKLTPLHLDEAELRQIAARYPAGKVLWRVEVDHFSPWDYNWPYACAEFCEPPQQEEPPAQEAPECEATGSIIGCLNQSLGESVAINGSDLDLAYSTVRMPGYKEAYTVDIPLTGTSLPPGVKGVEVIVSIAGREFARSYDAAANLRHTFTWDGKDAYGRTLDGAQHATIRIGYVYGAVYMASREAQQRSFGQFGIAVLTRSMAREEITAWQTYTRPLGASGTGSDALGGWTIAQHHTYDPIGRVLYLGDGTKRTSASVRNQVGPWFGAGAGDDLGLVRGIAAAPDGSLYVAEADRNRVRRIAPDGTATVVAGGGSPADGLGDGLPATAARLSNPSDVDLGPDGALYVSDTGNSRVRRIGSDGRITTVAGGGDPDELGDDGRAREASLDGPRGIAVASDGTLYIADAGHDRIRRVTPDGHITTAAGGGDQGLGDGGSALAAELDLPTDVAIDAAGTLYIADSVHHRVRAVTATGVISTLAGDGVAGGQGDGGPATEARLSAPQGVEVDTGGNVYIADRARHLIRRVSATGHITRYAGTGVSGSGADGGAPARTALSFPQDVAVMPDGSVAIADTANHRIRRVGRGLPGYTDADLAVPSGNGAEVYLFDSAGKHVRTANAVTKATIHEFAYDSAGRLKSITDRDGLTTRIERDGTGKPTAIVAPNGRVTRLFLNDAGLLESIEDPAQHATRLTYHDGGLLKSFTRPEGGKSTFEYDTRGRLKKDIGPDGRSSTLTVTPQPGGNIVTVETTLGRKTVYRTVTGPDGIRRRTVTEPGGATTTSYTTEDGESVVVTPDGTKRTMVVGPDPRWGMAAPIAERETIETPSGKRRVVRKARTVTLTDPRDLLSVEKVTDTVTVGGRTYTATITAPAAGGPDEWTAKATTPEGRETTRVFNSQGHVLRDQVKGRAAARYEYDARGRFKTLKRGSGEAERTASFQFTDHDEVASATNQFGDVATFTYDDAGRPESRTAFDGTSVTGYEHNDDGLTTSVTPPGRSAFTRDIGADGLLHGSTAPAVAQQPNQTTFEYDLDARIKRQDLPGPRAIGHTYDLQSGHETSVTLERGTISTDVEPATGRVMSITAPGGVKLDFGYDGGIGLGWTWSGPVAGSVEREVDDELRTTRRTVNGADPVTFSYDDDGLLEHAGDEALGYDPDNGALTSLTLGALTETWTYDEFGAAQSMAAKRGAETVYALSFVRDTAGRITKRTETIGGETHVLEYTYDERGRLQTVKRDGTQIADPEYDANGNRTDGDTEHDAQDRITKRGPATYGSDPEGHRISRTAPDGTTAYAYDELGNLLGVTLPGGKHVEYVIDGRQRRIGKKVDGQLVQGLLWEGQLRPSAQLDGDGQVVSRFVYGARGNVPDYMIRAGEKYRLVADERGSVRLVVNVANGQVAQRLDYDEWGRVTADTNPGFQPFGYAGGLYDHDTGLVRFGVRDYDGETGRWMSKDPSGFGAGDTNLYAYAANDPVNNADPNGLWTVPTQTPFDMMDYFKDRTRELWPDTVDKDGNVTTNLDRWNGPGDAWRHCAGSCEVARQYGESIAEFLGDAHEIEGDIVNDQERGEKEMDLFNNACGREIGKRAESLTDCEQGCFRALRNGELKTYEQGTTPTFSEEISKMMQDFAGFSGTGFNGFPRMGGMGF